MYISGVVKKVQIGMRSLPRLLYAVDCYYAVNRKRTEIMIGRFIEACKRMGLTVNADKSKMMLLGGEEGPVCNSIGDGIST